MTNHTVICAHVRGIVVSQTLATKTNTQPMTGEHYRQWLYAPPGGEGRPFIFDQLVKIHLGEALYREADKLAYLNPVLLAVLGLDDEDPCDHRVCARHIIAHHCCKEDLLRLGMYDDLLFNQLYTRG
jgi:hypothetical protein